MKNCLLISLTSALLLAPFGAFADTFEGKGSVRLEACKAAKDRGRMSMENKYTNMTNYALGGKNQLKIGDCDCSEDSGEISTGRWTCIVEVEISSVTINSPPARTTPQSLSGIKNVEGKGDSQTEACSGAKYLAERSVPPGTRAKSFGACHCSLTNGSSFRYLCSVDVTYDAR